MGTSHYIKWSAPLSQSTQRKQQKINHRGGFRFLIHLSHKGLIRKYVFQKTTSQISNKKASNLIGSLQRENMANKHRNSCLFSLVIWEMQIKTIMRCHLHPPDWQKFRSLTVLLVGEDGSLWRLGLGCRSWACHDFGNVLLRAWGHLLWPHIPENTYAGSLPCWGWNVSVKVLACSQCGDQISQQVYFWSIASWWEMNRQGVGSCLDLGLDLWC